MRTAVFESFDAFHRGWAVYLDRPQAVHVAYCHEQVLLTLQLDEEAAQRGHWAAVMLSYEAVPSLDPVLATHPPGTFPLAWCAVFDQAGPLPAEIPPERYEVSHWDPQITRDQYAHAIERIRDHIAHGETYQVNYTFPLRSRFRGDPWSYYRTLCAAQGAGYCAYLDLGRYRVLSLSPELFFERRGETLIARPMKGTLPRGRWMEEDREQSGRLTACPKNRAENVMIVDLLRNDLGKISVPGSVRVARLFEVERYETLWQMTSTICSICRPDLGLADLFCALFPCGSVTGAPKVRTTEIIHELEPFPRQVYTGAIGFVRPGGNAIFNVAIRTILLDTQTGVATLGVGSGITYDSTAQDEYDECLLKTHFLHRHRPAFRLLESILLDSGAYSLIERHITRMRSSAGYFGFVWNEEAVLSALSRMRAGHASGRWKVRLLAARDGALELEAHPLGPEMAAVRRLTFAPEPIDSRDPFLYHKTTHRAIYERALRACPGYDDVILWNERGEVTESSFANLVLTKEGKKWTPPRASGLLAGTLRDELLARGEIRERVISKDELCQAGSFFLINSVRGWMHAALAR